MSPLSAIILLETWIFFNSPISWFNNFIEDLPVTSNPDTYLTPTQMIRKYGYPAESHIIETKDGYLLELHRIPNYQTTKVKKLPPILLLHGFVDSSNAWVLQGPEKSLAFKLAKEGYDVWMGNFRGNSFSKAHVRYTPSQNVFWDFSFDEIVKYDIPATIDYILSITNHQKLLYVGHSAGNTVFLYLPTVFPEYNDKVIALISLAPAIAIPHSKSTPYVQLVPVAKPLSVLYNLYSSGSYDQHDVLQAIMDKYICPIRAFNFDMCELPQLLAFGWAPQQYNKSLTTNAMKYYPAGTSVKCLLHVLQLIKPGLPSFFDHGKLGNLQKYGNETPPLYDISKVQIPVKVYYGGLDILVTPIDIKYLYEKIPHPSGLVKIEQFNHNDFTNGKDVDILVNEDVIRTIKNFTDFLDN